MSSSLGHRKSSSTSSGTSHPLQKGSACLNCRRRKVKCDGVKPICGTCASVPALRDCEYSDSGTTRTQLLEEQIAIFESRIRELEALPANSNAAVRLTQPYSVAGNLQSSQHQASSSASSFSPNPASPHLLSVPEKLPVQLHQAIIGSFLRCCTEIGFFLNVGRFTNTVMNVDDFGWEPPSIALLQAVYLWGVHLSTSPELLTLEPYFLSTAVQQTSAALSSTHTHKIIHRTQAEVLLAQYFFRNARMLEGKYHTSAAVSLLLGARFHKIRSIEGGGVVGLPDPSDLVEEGERTNGFWTVMILNNCWTPLESNIIYETIDTPWPLEMQSYSQIYRSPEFRTSQTVQKFLSRAVPDGSDGASMIALYAKASILFERSSTISHRFQPNMPQSLARQFFDSFSAQDALVQRFLQDMPSIPAMTAAISHGMALMIYTLAYSAVIQLHRPFIAINPASRGRIISSVRPIVHILDTINVAEVLSLNAFLAVLWTYVCQFLIQEISDARDDSINSSGAPMSQNEGKYSNHSWPLSENVMPKRLVRQLDLT
ncbi:Zn(2)-Cys(6) binuclear cluster domain-containing protein [Desarmillaria tabescens]|uniref:Zn(2)-Cys(6) binuclear cluster domain-containing protein n=1 Tax=Armillaria tabescens TaxID=1929756 RepID=A0AA39NPB9_ARMTA|nr:Zn(2)-Cys(6) binuclear cluster domain-containing protein [Desarmillaria tabescens]KAK0469357.1 Zn(2)-Cys(6) binuclear cluster domain-containing protein [Desarmillaria tabescens]